MAVRGALTSLDDLLGATNEASDDSNHADYPYSRGHDDAQKVIEYAKGFAQRTLEKLFS